MTTTCLLRLLPVVSALCQLLGTAGIVWGLRITSSKNTYEGSEVGERPYALVWKEHPWAFNAGVVLLLLGLALAVVVAIFPA